jgi:hypothetical protein
MDSGVFFPLDGGGNVSGIVTRFHVALFVDKDLLFPSGRSLIRRAPSVTSGKAVDVALSVGIILRSDKSDVRRGVWMTKHRTSTIQLLLTRSIKSTSRRHFDRREDVTIVILYEEITFTYHPYISYYIPTHLIFVGRCTHHRWKKPETNFWLRFFVLSR